MKINHHLDDATLFSYVAGSLSQGLALVVASHLSICDECRQRVFELEAIGGALLDNLTDTLPSDNQTESHETTSDKASNDEAESDKDSPELAESNQTSLDKVLALLDGAKPATDTPSEQAEVPKPLSDYIGDSLDNLAWKRFAPGFFYFDVISEGPGMCRLLKVAPGKSTLPHTHQCNELTLLLRGSYSDEIIAAGTDTVSIGSDKTKLFTQGDIADFDDQIEHQPRADEDEGCICLVATDHRLKFTTFWGKILKPIIPF